MRYMTEQEAREFVRHNKFGILSLADQGRAYGVPLFYGYDGREIYFHTRGGLKTQFVRTTSEACFTIARVVGLDDWASVHVLGVLERVRDPADQMRAYLALMSVPLPPDLGDSGMGEPLRHSDAAITYKLHVERVSGRYSTTPGLRDGSEIAVGGM